ncbi:MAG: hypothetical protein AB7O59_08895 [Pirellulales bacterium]
MKSPYVFIAAIAVSGALLIGSTLLAQRPAAAPRSGPTTVLVDVTTMAKDSPKLKQQLEALKKEYEGEATALRKESELGNQMGAELGKLPPGSPEFKKLEKDLFKMRADFELRGKRATDAVQEKEALLYYEFARELQSELARFAQATGTQLILRNEPSPPDYSDPRNVLRELNKLIVYQRGVDVTPAMQEAMARRAAAGANTATRRPPASSAPQVQARPVQR